MLPSWHTLQAFFIRQRTQVCICMWLQHKAITSERHIKFRKTKTIQHNKQMQMTTTKLLTHEWAWELAKQELKRPVVKPPQSHQRDGHTYKHMCTPDAAAGIRQQVSLESHQQRRCRPTKAIMSVHKDLRDCYRWIPHQACMCDVVK